MKHCKFGPNVKVIQYLPTPGNCSDESCCTRTMCCYVL